MLGRRIHWCQLQRREVHQYEIAASIGVHRVQRLVDTLDVVGDCLAGNLRVGDERVIAEVIGADPDSVNCFFGRNVEELFAGRWDLVFAVCEKSRNFIL